MNHPFFEYPKYWHHATKPGIVSHDADTDAQAKAAGYVEGEYQQTPQAELPAPLPPSSEGDPAA